MITTDKLIRNLKEYIITQLDSMSKTTPVIGLAKPIITRVVNNNINKITNLLGLITDENGNIEIENILGEMIDNVINANPFTVNTGIIGDIEIGNGNIKLNIPLTDKKLILNQNDLEEIKNILTNTE